MLLAKFDSVAKKFAAMFRRGGLLKLLQEERGQRCRGELRFGDQPLYLAFLFSECGTRLQDDQLFAELLALQLGHLKLFREVSDLRGVRGVLAFTEGLRCGGVDHSIDTDDIANGLYGTAIGGPLGENDMRHADAGKIGVGESQEGSPRLGFEDTNVATNPTIFVARVDYVADEVTCAAVARLQAIRSVVEKDGLLVVERHRFPQCRFGVAIAVPGVWSRQSDVQN